MDNDTDNFDYVEILYSPVRRGDVGQDNQRFIGNRFIILGHGPDAEHEDGEWLADYATYDEAILKAEEFRGWLGAASSPRKWG